MSHREDKQNQNVDLDYFLTRGDRSLHLIKFSRGVGAIHNLSRNTVLLDERQHLALQYDEQTRQELSDLREKLDAQRERLDELDDTSDTNPPGLAQFLARLLSPKEHGETILGDLQEIFQRDCKAFGRRRARLLYWSGTIRSVGPLVFTKLRNWGLFAAVIEYGRRKIGW